MTEPRTSAIVVIAASSGGLVPLTDLVSKLPAFFPAAVLVASHTRPGGESRLPTLLSAAGPLPASLPRDGQRLERGRILVAPADRHMIVVPGNKVRLTHEPRENLVRPAADVLFRSAARAFGRRAIGVVLSGSGRDGAAGLAAIQAAGGIAVVQAPEDAQFPSMPSAALAVVRPDACAPSFVLGDRVDHLLRERLRSHAAPGRSPARARADRSRGRRRARGLSLRGLRVLVVEDRYLLASEIVRMLQGLGCRPLGPAPDLSSGLEVIGREAERLGCAVLDVDLRGKTVFPLASALSARGIPLLFATGYGAGVLPAPWASAVRLEKPFEATMLQDALHRALEAPRQPAGAGRAPARPIDDQSQLLKDSRNSVMEWRALRRRTDEPAGVQRGVVGAGGTWKRTAREAVAQAAATLERARDALAESKGRRSGRRSLAGQAMRTSPEGEGSPPAERRARGVVKRARERAQGENQ